MFSSNPGMDVLEYYQQQLEKVTKERDELKRQLERTTMCVCCPEPKVHALLKTIKQEPVPINLWKNVTDVELVQDLRHQSKVLMERNMKAELSNLRLRKEVDAFNAVRMKELRTHAERVAKLEQRLDIKEDQIAYMNLTNLQRAKVQRRTFLETHSKHESLLKYIRQRWSVNLEEAKAGHSQLGQDLVKAAGDNHIPRMDLLRRQGADLEARSSQRSNTALIEAASKGNIYVVQYLLQYGADIQAENRYGLTARNVAIRARRFKVAEFLADREIRESSASNSPEEGSNQDGEQRKTRIHA